MAAAEISISRAAAPALRRFRRKFEPAAAAGELLAILRVEVGLNDLDAAPIAAEFFGDDHGERGADALAHFGFAAPDFAPPSEDSSSQALGENGAVAEGSEFLVLSGYRENRKGEAGSRPSRRRSLGKHDV